MKKTEFFKVESNKINRIRRHCPKCGPAVFLGEHKNRFSCGKCGYTEYKGGGVKQPQKIKEKPVEQPRKKQDKAEASIELPKTEIPESKHEDLSEKTKIEKFQDTKNK